MLKGVGRGYYRQLHQATVGSLICYSATRRAINPAVPRESSTAAPDALPSKPRTTHYNAEQPLLCTTSKQMRKRPKKSGQLKTDVTAKNHENLLLSPHTSPHLPPQILQMIDKLFAKKSQVSMLHFIRSSTISEYFLDRTNLTKVAEALVHTRYPHRANRVLLLAHKLGCPLKQNSYDGVAYQLAEAKHWHLIPHLVNLAKRQTGRTTVRLLNWRIRAIIEATQYGRLDSVLEEFELENLKPNRRTFHLLVSGHLRNHNVQSARACLKVMENAGFPADATTHATVVSVYRSLGPAADVQDHAFEALQDMNDRTSTITLNNLMQLYIDRNNLPGILRALTFFHQGDANTTLLDEFGESFTARGGNGTLDHRVTSESNGEVSCPAQPFILPDVATFTILINYMIKRHRLPDAIRLFDRMLTVGVKPDAAAAAALIRAYIGANQAQIAIRIIANMCREHNVPRSLFKSLGLTSEHTDNHQLQLDDIPLTAEVFNALMKYALNVNGLKGARTVLRIMRFCQVKPDTRTIEIFMFHLANVEHVGPRGLVRVLRNLTTTVVPPTLNHLHIIMRSILCREQFLVRGSGWDVTAAKFSSGRRDLPRYPECRISSIADSFDPTAGIELPRKLPYRALVRPIVQSLSARRIMSNRTTIALRLKHEAVTKSNLMTAKLVFQEMLDRGMHPTSRHFTALMEGYALLGDLRSAVKVMHSAFKAGIRPSVVMFTILIVGHARRGHPDRAMQAFQGMVEAGIRPDGAAVDAIASAYFVVGAYKMARRVLLVLWPHVLATPEDTEVASLKQLVRVFRARHANRDPDDHPKRLNKSEKTIIRWKIIRLINAWKSLSDFLRKRRGYTLRDKMWAKKRKRIHKTYIVLRPWLTKKNSRET